MEEKTGGIIPELPADALPHWDLAKKYNIIDFETGVKVTGAGFPFYIGKGARLQRALIQFFLDEAWKAGYTEVEPPFVVNEASGYGTGQLPDKEGQMYHVTLDNPLSDSNRRSAGDQYLPRRDHPRGRAAEKELRLLSCWRREAGSYGKDVRGLNRLHQFDKVEIVRVERPEDSYRALEEIEGSRAGTS